MRLGFYFSFYCDFSRPQESIPSQLAGSGLPSCTGGGILADASCAKLSVENDRFRHRLLD
jgi:hypothetical protein